ncbi:helix-turn-helix domain-containing protein [Gelidibacter sp.]|uniref:helix-turn-helix domain-containing protein n=1 Tax=Gelidibacter sp. TaxID=2018083 RepID=UPI002D0E0FA9|nr:helix-turn-helix domain-containing protein [Gelidibacter sp.]HUH28915.1 helix-turn-helix domain-containing protein [Gelidibacter sp.]
MPVNIITTDDLREFKMELLDAIKNLLANQSKGKLKRYLKSSEVMDLLQISPGTLQTLRINGTLPYTKIGGIIFYDAEEIQQVLSANRVQHGSTFNR